MQINYGEYDVNGKKVTVRKEGSSLTVMVIDPETGSVVADYFTSRDVHFDDMDNAVYRMVCNLAVACFGSIPGEKLIRYGQVISDAPACTTDDLYAIQKTIEGFDA